MHLYTNFCTCNLQSKKNKNIQLNTYLYNFPTSPDLTTTSIFLCTPPEQSRQKDGSFLLLTINSLLTISYHRHQSPSSHSFIYNTTQPNNYSLMYQSSYERWNEPCPSVIAYRSFSLILSWKRKGITISSHVWFTMKRGYNKEREHYFRRIRRQLQVIGAGHHTGQVGVCTAAAKL